MHIMYLFLTEVFANKDSREFIITLYKWEFYQELQKSYESTNLSNEFYLIVR